MAARRFFFSSGGHDAEVVGSLKWELRESAMFWRCHMHYNRMLSRNNDPLSALFREKIFGELLEAGELANGQRCPCPLGEATHPYPFTPYHINNLNQ